MSVSSLAVQPHDSTQLKENTTKIAPFLLSACVLMSGAAFAEDAMKKDGMAQDGMAKDDMMKKDGMAK